MVVRLCPRRSGIKTVNRFEHGKQIVGLPFGRYPPKSVLAVMANSRKSDDVGKMPHLFRPFFVFRQKAVKPVIHLQ